MARLKDAYKEKIVPAMMERFKYTNVNQVPRLEKIVVNMGVGDAKDNPKAIESAVKDLTTITGQKPIVTVAKKSVANFKPGIYWMPALAPINNPPSTASLGSV